MGKTATLTLVRRLKHDPVMVQIFNYLYKTGEVKTLEDIKTELQRPDGRGISNKLYHLHVVAGVVDAREVVVETRSKIGYYVRRSDYKLLGDITENLARQTV